MFFSKPLHLVSTNDVRAFCQRGMPEGKQLDYKQEIPSSDKDILAKTVAAFANTNGGTLIIGVSDDENDKPLPPFEGIQIRDGIRNQIEQIIRGRIQPVPFSEVHVCPEDNGKTFAIVRVPESTLAPHYLVNHKSIYVRTGESNKPEDLIHPDKLPWLFEGRERSAKFREESIRRAQARFEQLFPSPRLQDEAKEASPTRVLCTGIAVPVYPDETLFHFKETENLLKSIAKGEDYTTLPERSISGGLVFAKEYSHGPIKFAQLNDLGMFFFRRTVEFDHRDQLVESLPIICRICELLCSAELMHEKLDFWGPLLLRFEIEGLLNKSVKVPGYGYEDYDGITKMIEDSVSIELALPAGAIRENILALLMNCCRKILWKIGLHKTPAERIADLIEKNRCYPSRFDSKKIKTDLLEAETLEIPLLNSSLDC